MSALLAEMWIPGRPRTKGSLKVITPRGQRPRLIEDHVHSKPWRQRMAGMMKLRLVEAKSNEVYAGPVALAATFVFERVGPTAQSLPYPTLNAGVNACGDIDKLLRNLLDALQDAAVIVDDAQVCSIGTSKVWGPEAGVRLSVETL